MREVRQDARLNGHAPAEPADVEPVEEPEPAWTDDQLDRLRRLWHHRGAASWAVSDAVLELVPVAGSRRSNGAFARVRKLSDLVGAEYRTLLAYRNCAHCWPPPHRCGAASFAAHLAWTRGGPGQAAYRGSVLRRLAAEHGSVSVQHVRCEKAQRVATGGDKLLTRLRILAQAFAARDDVGVGPEAIRNGAARAIASAKSPARRSANRPARSNRHCPAAM